MVNFRYHLVSLIAVFIALAVGVILGAGPLQTRIASSMADDSGVEVDVAEVARLRAVAEAEAEGVSAIASQVLPSTLQGVNVVTVSLPGANSQDVATVRDDLSRAGATLVGSASLTDNWDSEAMDTYRQTLATPVESHLVTALDASVTPDGVIAVGIIEVLTTTGAERDLLKSILTDPSSPILTFEEEPEGNASAVVLIGARAGAGEATVTGADGTTVSRSVAAWTGMARALVSLPKGAVILGDASADTSLLAQLRTLGSQVSTVDSVGTATASLATVLALKAATTEVVNYGNGVGAEKVLPALP